MTSDRASDAPTSTSGSRSTRSSCRTPGEPRPNLTVNYGLRYEAQINPQPDEPNPAPAWKRPDPVGQEQFRPARRASRGIPGTTTGVSSGSTPGLFYSRTPALLIVSPFTANGVAQLQLTFTPTDAGAPTSSRTPWPHRRSGVGPPRSSVNIFDPDFQNPRTFQMSAGVEREIVRDLTVAVDYTYANMREPAAALRYQHRPARRARIRDGRLFYGNPRPNPSFNLIDRAESTAKGCYDALTLSARKRWSGGMNSGGTAASSSRRSTPTRRNKDDDSNERKFQDIFYQDWQNLAAEYTWSNNDVRHNFVMNGTWAFAHDVSVGAIFNTRSGAPYSRLSSVDINNDGAPNPNDRQFIDGMDTGRNSFRQPNHSRLDLRISKGFRAGRSRTFEAALGPLQCAERRKPVCIGTNEQQSDDGQPVVPEQSECRRSGLGPGHSPDGATERACEVLGRFLAGPGAGLFCCLCRYQRAVEFLSYFSFIFRSFP